MNFINSRLLILCAILMLSCTKEEDTTLKKDLKVLIVGNSVLKHAPAPNIGWNGDWGMAASAPDKDFLQVYNRLLQASNKYNSIEVSSKNIAGWENDFTFDLKVFDDLTSKTYDVIIVRLGENVSNTAEYQTALTKMINFFKSPNTKVIITGTVWEDPIKEEIQRKVALENGYTYIPFESFRSNIKNYALGLFENVGVAGHPSDLGMQFIGQLLYTTTLEVYQ